MSHKYIVKQSEEICKCLNQLRFRKILSDVYMEHIMAIIHSVFMPGYHGKIANTKYFSEKHRTSVAHFLNDGKWDSLEVERSFRKRTARFLHRGRYDCFAYSAFVTGAAPH